MAKKQGTGENLERAKSNRGKTKNDKNTKLLIDCLRRERMAHGDLQKATGIPSRTLSRILRTLAYWELAVKDETGRWAWFERMRTYATRNDLDVAVNHSKELIRGLHLVVVSLNIPERFLGPSVRGLDSIDERILKEAAEEHLRTGYDKIYGEIAVYRSLTIQLESLAGEIIRFGRDGVKLLTDMYYFRSMKSAVPKKDWKRLERLIEEIPGEKLVAIDEIEKTRTAAGNKIIGAIEFMIKKIENCEPLEGRCRLCPAVKVSSN
jgi:hypothetical protein